MVKKGKWFESKTFDLTKLKHPNKLVYPERKLPTYYGDGRRPDVSVNNPGDYDFIILECKDKKKGKKIEIGDIGQALDIGIDVGAKKIALVGNAPFRSSVINKAKARGVDLYNIIDPSDKRIIPHLKFNVLTNFVWPYRFRFSCYLFDKNLNIIADPSQVLLDDKLSIISVFNELWNSNKLTDAPGINKYRHEQFYMCERPDHSKGVIVKSPVDYIEFEYEVCKKSIVSSHLLANGFGFYDVKKGVFEVLSKEISVGPISFNKIITEGIEYTDKQELREISFIGHARYVLDSS